MVFYQDMLTEGFNFPPIIFKQKRLTVKNIRFINICRPIIKVEIYAESSCFKLIPETNQSI